MLLAACLAALPAPHAVQPSPQLTPRAVYERLLAYYTGAAATDFAFTFTMAGSDEQVAGTSRFALPLHGRFALSSVNQNLVAIADGRRSAADIHVSFGGEQVRAESGTFVKLNQALQIVIWGRYCSVTLRPQK